MLLFGLVIAGLIAYFVPDNFFTPFGGILENPFREADLLGDTFGNDVVHIVALHIEELVFDGRTAAIDNEYNHI